MMLILFCRQGELLLSLAIHFIEYYFFIYFLYIYLLYKSLDYSQLSIYIFVSFQGYLIISVIRLQLTSLKGLVVLIHVVHNVFKFDLECIGTDA